MTMTALLGEAALFIPVYDFMTDGRYDRGVEVHHFFFLGFPQFWSSRPFRKTDFEGKN